MKLSLLLAWCTFVRGLVPPSATNTPPSRGSALAIHDPHVWLEGIHGLSSLLTAEGPEIEGAGAPVGPIAAATIAVSGYAFEAGKERDEIFRKTLVARFEKQGSMRQF